MRKSWNPCTRRPVALGRALILGGVAIVDTGTGNEVAYYLNDDAAATRCATLTRKTGRPHEAHPVGLYGYRYPYQPEAKK